MLESFIHVIKYFLCSILLVLVAEIILVAYAVIINEYTDQFSQLGVSALVLSIVGMFILIPVIAI